jgi:hypothetical protein
MKKIKDQIFTCHYLKPQPGFVIDNLDLTDFHILRVFENIVLRSQIKIIPRGLNNGTKINNRGIFASLCYKSLFHVGI